jgi:hypothetical protein
MHHASDMYARQAHALTGASSRKLAAPVISASVPRRQQQLVQRYTRPEPLKLRHRARRALEYQPQHVCASRCVQSSCTCPLHCAVPGTERKPLTRACYAVLCICAPASGRAQVAGAAAAPSLQVVDSQPAPLGPSPLGADAVNFALWTRHASAVTLCLYVHSVGEGQPVATAPKKCTRNYQPAVSLFP